MTTNGQTYFKEPETDHLMEGDEKITEFTPTLRIAIAEKVLIAANGSLRFIFMDGMEISV